MSLSQGATIQADSTALQCAALNIIAVYCLCRFIDIMDIMDIRDIVDIMDIIGNMANMDIMEVIDKIDSMDIGNH